jgi:alanyl-tRNA synthetase
MIGFAELMEWDRKISQLAQASRRGISSKNLTMEAEQTSWLSKNGIPTTDSSMKYSWNIDHECRIVALFKGRGGSTSGFFDSVSVDDDAVGVILDSTSFYYESGGQVSDTGVLKASFTEEKSFLFDVDMVQIYAGYVVHTGRLREGSCDLVLGMPVVASVDYVRRSFIAPNHTMTHVLNYSLKKVLMNSSKTTSESSDLCDQKGSLVDSEKLRFDFAWNSSLSIDQISQVENLVNQQISSNLSVFAQNLPLSTAGQIYGLRRVFGENYPDPVRVLSIGASIEDLQTDSKNEKWKNYSIEFCGGTHISNTKEAEDFVIVEESGISKGIRRIIGLTRDAAKAARRKSSDILNRLSEMENMPGGPELKALSKNISREVLKSFFNLYSIFEPNQFCFDLITYILD